MEKFGAQVQLDGYRYRQGLTHAEHEKFVKKELAHKLAEEVIKKNFIDSVLNIHQDYEFKHLPLDAIRYSPGLMTYKLETILITQEEATEYERLKELENKLLMKIGLVEKALRSLKATKDI